MKKIKIILISIFCLAILVLSGLYFGALFILPGVLNSPNTAIKIQKYANEKFHTVILIDNLKFSSNPGLFLDVKADKISFKGTEEKDAAIFKSVSGRIGLGGIKNLNADYLYFNSNNLKKNKNSKQRFDPAKLPQMHIAKGEIYLDNVFEAKINDLNILKSTGGKQIDFKGKIISRKRFAIFKEYKADAEGHFKIKKNKTANLLVFGVLIADNLNGTTDISLLPNVPAHFDREVFRFDGKNVKSEAIGTLGGEKVYHNFEINNFLLDKRESKGSVYSNVTQKVVKFMPNFQIQNSASIKVDYDVKNKKNGINYTINLKKGSDIFYKGAYFGLRDKDRKIYIETLKDGSNLYITNYNYSTVENERNFLILNGDAKFVKIKNHFQPKYLAIKTNGWAPASTTGSFNRYIAGGSYKGDIYYDFPENIVTGNFAIKDFTHKDFYVEKAEINADKNFINILANGTYRREAFRCKLRAKNKLDEMDKRVVIYDMDLFLDKYKFRKKRSGKNFLPRKNAKRHRLRKLASKVRNIDIAIDNWTVTAGSIIYDNVILKDVKLIGSLKNDIFKFSTSKIAFAQGTLSANGQYDFKHKNSEIDFFAKNVNSNIAAALLFNLPGQVEGTADGTLNINTHNKLEDIQAYVTFKINDGYLPKIGTKEFLFRHNNKKFKISDIINIKGRNKQNLSSDITGSLYMDNYRLKDIKLTSKQRYLALLIEGNYDILNGTADLMLFGKYNSAAQKGIKIFFIPISFVMKFLFKPENTFKNYKTKLEKIPPIDAKTIETNYFRVKLNGNLIQNDINVEMKSIIE